MGEADAIDPSTKMCFFDSGGGGHSSHARPVELQPRGGNRRVKTLEELGYEAVSLGFRSNPARPIGAFQIEFYMIRLPSQRVQRGYIALLAADGNGGLLYALT